VRVLESRGRLIAAGLQLVLCGLLVLAVAQRAVFGQDQARPAGAPDQKQSTVPPAPAAPPPGPAPAQPPPPPAQTPPSPVPPPAPPIAAQCQPRCREGYTCIEGRCVSLCNPQCGEGQTCTAEGACQAPRSRRSAPIHVRIGTALGQLSGSYSGTSQFGAGTRSASGKFNYVDTNIEVLLTLGLPPIKLAAGVRGGVSLADSDCKLYGIGGALLIGTGFYVGPEFGLDVAGSKCCTGDISFNGNSISVLALGGRVGWRVALGSAVGIVPELRLYTNVVTRSAKEVRLYPAAQASDGIANPSVRWIGGTLGLLVQFPGG